MFTGAIHFGKNNYSAQLFQTASKPQQVIEKNKNTDTVTITARGKNNQLLKGLMEQKTRLTESKNKLMGNALEEGATIETIQAQLKSYEEQIEQIDKQIEKLSSVPKEERTQNTYTNPKNLSLKSATNNNIDTAFLAADTALKNAQTVFSQAKKAEQKADILEIEIKQDKQPAAGLDGCEKMIDKKEDKLEELKENSAKQLAMAGEQLEQAKDCFDTVQKEKTQEQEGLNDSEQDRK